MAKAMERVGGGRGWLRDSIGFAGVDSMVVWEKVEGSLLHLLHVGLWFRVV